MCRWLAYQGEPIYLDELVYKPEHSLVHQSLEARKAVTRVNADGFGLGWYTERSTPGSFTKCCQRGEMKTCVRWRTIFALIVLWRMCVRQRALPCPAQIATHLFSKTGCFCTTGKLPVLSKLNCP